jgi:hypothetical protein
MRFSASAPFPAEPDALASEYAAHLISRDPSMRLGLVAANRGADALATAGWTGPANYTNDTGEIAAVVRSWEDRYGARVIGAGFADLYLSVAAPPTTLDEALHIAAEHFAFCPDNIWQNSHPHTLAEVPRTFRTVAPLRLGSSGKGMVWLDRRKTTRLSSVKRP